MRNSRTQLSGWLGFQRPDARLLVLDQYSHAEAARPNLAYDLVPAMQRNVDEQANLGDSTGAATLSLTRGRRTPFSVRDQTRRNRRGANSFNLSLGRRFSHERREPENRTGERHKRGPMSNVQMHPANKSMYLVPHPLRLERTLLEASASFGLDGACACALVTATPTKRTGSVAKGPYSKYVRAARYCGLRRRCCRLRLAGTRNRCRAICSSGTSSSSVPTTRPSRAASTTGKSSSHQSTAGFFPCRRSLYVLV